MLQGWGGGCEPPRRVFPAGRHPGSAAQGKITGGCTMGIPIPAQGMLLGCEWGGFLAAP